MSSSRQILHEIETAIAAVEIELGVSITIVDNNGVFRTAEGDRLLGPRRQSHKKNRVCALGFCDACIQHCRYEMNARGDKERRPFVHCCWKQVVEMAVPLVWHDAHLGTLFAGTWRRTEGWEEEMPPDLPEEWRGEYTMLPSYNPARLERIGAILNLFAKGILEKLEEHLLVGNAADGRRAEIARFLRYNYAKPLRLGDLADLLHLSESRTSHLVRQLFGKSFQQMLRQERVEAAKVMLLTTELTAGQIAELVGIPDEYHFNRTFKDIAGSPPGRFRRQNKLDSTGV